jgi:parallel beta-helix repeat protein
MGFGFRVVVRRAFYSNNVSSNGQGGIFVNRSATADIASNTINGNGTSWTSGSTDGNGVWVSQGSYITLGERDSTHFTGLPNITTVNNANAGIRCTMNSTIYGRLGATDQLNGAVSQFGGGSTANTFSSNCVTDLVTP